MFYSNLPDRYKNLYLSISDFDNELNDINIKNNYQKFETQYFFVYKDPITGRRCSSPIQEPEKKQPKYTSIPVGNLRNDSLYLIQTKDKTYKIRSPNSINAIKNLNLNYKDVIRASIICEGV